MDLLKEIIQSMVTFIYDFRRNPITYIGHLKKKRENFIFKTVSMIIFWIILISIANSIFQQTTHP